MKELLKLISKLPLGTKIIVEVKGDGKIGIRLSKYYPNLGKTWNASRIYTKDMLNSLNDPNIVFDELVDIFNNT